MVLVIDSKNLLLKQLCYRELLDLLVQQENTVFNADITSVDYIDAICKVHDSGENVIYRDSIDKDFTIDKTVSLMRRFGVRHRVVAESKDEVKMADYINKQFPQLTDLEVVENTF